MYPYVVAALKGFSHITFFQQCHVLTSIQIESMIPEAKKVRIGQGPDAVSMLAALQKKGISLEKFTMRWGRGSGRQKFALAPKSHRITYVF